MKLFTKAFTGSLLIVLFTLNTCAPLMAQKNDKLIQETEKKQVIEKAFSLLRENYIFPDKVAPTEKNIWKKFAEGNYSKTNTVNAFLTSLNKDMEQLINDRHVNVFFDPVRVKQIRLEAKGDSTKPAFNPEYLKRAKFENYMVRKAERLDGNVGYLKLDLFLDLQLAKPTIAAAMNFLSNSSAIIIDLRQNGGGQASTVNFLLNYFLPDSTLVSRFTSRITKTTRDIYVEHDNIVNKFPAEVPVYILHSRRTSSAAEAFSYTLQSLKRAKVVGDTSNGEANPGYAFSVNDDMWLMIPTSVNANPITKTNWQGVGVIPDVQVRSDKAFDAAQAAIYKVLSESPADKQAVGKYTWLATGFQAKAFPVKVDKKIMQSFVGKYENDRIISVDASDLFYQRVGGDKKKLIPITEDLYELDGSAFFRVKFIRNENGETTRLDGIYDDGEIQPSKKIAE